MLLSTINSLQQAPSMVFTKKSIQEKYQKLRDFLGYQPSAIQFYIETGISRADLRKIFRSNAFSALQKSCGDIPNVIKRMKNSPVKQFRFSAKNAA